MPKLLFAFSAGEFLDEELGENWVDGFEVYNPNSRYPFEYWSLY